MGKLIAKNTLDDSRGMPVKCPTCRDEDIWIQAKEHLFKCRYCWVEINTSKAGRVIEFQE